MTLQPDDNYQPGCADPEQVRRLAAACLRTTRRPQRVHVHAKGERCQPGCELLEP